MINRIARIARIAYEAALVIIIAGCAAALLAIGPALIVLAG